MRRCLLYIDLLDSSKHKLEQGENYPPRINGTCTWINGIHRAAANTFLKKSGV
jgi:hypothetical protein